MNRAYFRKKLCVLVALALMGGLFQQTAVNAGAVEAVPEPVLEPDHTVEAIPLEEDGSIAVPAEESLAGAQEGTPGKAMGVIGSGKCGAEGDDVSWTLSGTEEECVLTITGRGKMKDYAYGETPPWLAHVTGIKKLVVEKGVTHIGESSFISMSFIEEITLPEGLLSIGRTSFSGLYSLKAIELPASLAQIGIGAFAGCKELREIDIPVSVDMLQDNTFSSCTGLKKAVFHEGLTAIGQGAFYGCSSLESLHIPSTVSGSLDERTFWGCTGLRAITVSQGNPVYDSRDGCNALIRSSDGVLLKGCEESFLPEGIKAIADSAFLNCKGLQSIAFPESLQSIGTSAFEGCSAITSLHIGQGVTSIGSSAFKGCSGLDEITVDGGNASYHDGNGGNVLVRSSDQLLLQGSNHAVIPSGVTRIGDYAFYQMKGLTGVVLPQSLTEVGEYAFCGCVALREAVLPDSLTELGTGSFDACRKLRSITFSKNLTRIPEAAFSGCYSLEKALIPPSVNEIGRMAFQDCHALREVTIPEGVTEIPDSCFQKCRNLTKVKLPSTVTVIGYWAFDNTVSLAVLGLPEGLESIEDYAFCDSGGGIIPDVPHPLETVYYGGSASGWSAVSVGEFGNERLAASGFIYDTEMPDAFPVRSVSLDVTEYTLEKGGFAVLRADCLPHYASVSSMSWHSGNEAVARVDQDGRVDAVSPGNTWISVTEEGGQRAQCRIKVVDTAQDKSLGLGRNANNNSYLRYHARPIATSLYRQGSGYGLLRAVREEYYEGTMPEYHIILSQYDASHTLLKRREIPQELPKWGGFYAGEDAFYIVTGQSNPGESSELETFRVTKYDSDWNRLGSAPLFESNTTSPFSSGSLSMEMKGDYLLVHTCHIMYESGDGYNHQSNASFLVDTKELRICDDIMELYDEFGYVSHSFHQLVTMDEDGVVMLDHGDGFPRALQLHKSYQDITRGYIEREGEDSFKDAFLLEFPGDGGNNITGATAGGLAMGNSRVVIAGSSVIQDEKNTERKTYNIFVATAGRDMEDPDIRYLTSYPEGEAGATNPRLVKFGENRFLVLWSRIDPKFTNLSDSLVRYVEVNEKGEPVSPIYQHEGELSDCIPIVEDGQIKWFVCNSMADGTILTESFYGISTSDLQQFYENGTSSPSKPEEDQTTPSDNAAVSQVTLNCRSAILTAGEVLKLSAVVSPFDAADKTVSWDSTEGTVAEVGQDGLVRAVSAGNAKIMAQAKDGSGCFDACNVTVLPSEVLEEDMEDNPKAREEGRIWAAGLSENYYYTGYAIKPQVRLYHGCRRLTEKKDYTVSYKNNKRVSVPGAAKPAVIIKLKGNYSGNKKLFFNILPTPLSRIRADEVFAEYRKGRKNNTKKPELSLNGDPVRITGKDLELKYLSLSSDEPSGCSEAGRYRIRITAKGGGGFTGSLEVPLTVCEGIAMAEVRVSGYKKRFPYTGNPVVPDFIVRSGTDTLSPGRDYTVSLNGNVEIGTAEAILRGNGRTTFGSRRVSFRIVGKYALSEEGVKLSYGEDIQYYTYGGSKPRILVSHNGAYLKEGVDYKVSYRHNKMPEDASAAKAPQVIIKGMGKYKTAESRGIIRKFSIVPRPLSTLLLEVSDKSYSKTAGAFKKTKLLFVDEGYVDQKLKRGEDKDYTVVYSTREGTDTPAAGELVSVTVSAGRSGRYTGGISGSFRIIKPVQDINKATVKINGGKPCSYDENGVEPGQEGAPGLILTVRQGNQSVSLNKGADYTILGYFNNRQSTGRAVVLLRGKGSYAGVRAVRFRIGPARAEDVIKPASLSISRAFDILNRSYLTNDQKRGGL